jgi:hypoxanthine phosphoribosyltransferase
MTAYLHPDIERVLIDADSIQQRVRELAAEIDRDYADKPRLLLVGVLKGPFLMPLTSWLSPATA